MYNIEQRREEVIAHLKESFSRSILTLEEYETRLDMANAALTLSDLNLLVVDIQGRADQFPPSASSPASSSGLVLDSTRGEQRSLALMGTQKLSGNWLKKDSVLLQVFMGSMKCDLTRTRLFPHNKIRLYSIMSEVRIFVPEGGGSVKQCHNDHVGNETQGAKPEYPSRCSSH